MRRSDAGEIPRRDAPRPRSAAAGVLALSVVLGLAPSLVPTAGAEAATVGPRPVRGAFAFHYAYRLTEADLRWLARFRVAVLASPLPAREARRLRRAGTTLFLYEWLTGFYRNDHPGSWEDFVVRTRPQWVLNPERPDPGPDGSGRAHFYDPSAADFRRAWAGELSRRLERASYQGVFLDLVGHPHVPERLLRRYTERHPETPFDEALVEQIRSLQRARPATLIFTNQGYRLPDVLLPVADYDLSESLMTSAEGGEPVEVFLDGRGRVRTHETFYRSWDALRQIMPSVEAEVRRHNPRMQPLHLNYVAPRLQPTGRTRLERGTAYPVFRERTDRAAVFYGYAVAKLWGHDSFSALAGVRPARDEVYFVDLGHPLGETWEERDGLVARYYEKGVVVVNPSEETRTALLESPLLPPDVGDLWDCYRGKPVGSLAVTIEPTVSAASGRRYPAGRVYLHRR